MCIRDRGFILLALYNLIIILPFLIIVFSLYALDVKTMDLKVWMMKGRRLINMFIGFGLVGLGLFVLFSL